MGYQSILVHVDDGERCATRVALAAQLARAYDAELSGAYLVPTRELTPFTSAMLPDTVVENRLRESGEAQAGAEAIFRAAAETAGLLAVEWSAPAGRAIDQAILHARYADITVVGQPFADDPHAGFAHELVHAVVLGSGRPALVVPYAGEFATAGECVLVGWKESRESARAVHDAMPLLKRAREVVVVSMSAPDAPGARETQSDRGIAAWLRRHGIAADVRHEFADDNDVGNLLLGRTADVGADLVVMGAYSRPRLSEIVLGGVTRLMLQSMPVPVLMSH